MFRKYRVSGHYFSLNPRSTAKVASVKLIKETTIEKKLQSKKNLKEKGTRKFKLFEAGYWKDGGKRKEA